MSKNTTVLNFAVKYFYMFTSKHQAHMDMQTKKESSQTNYAKKSLAKVVV